MQIRQFRYGSDNLSYLIYGKNQGLAIDGGAIDDILSFTRANGLELRCITNTHAHPDHTSGNSTLLERSKALFRDHNRLAANGGVDLENETIRVYHTPGHTEDSVTFHLGKYLITGDTLFNGTVGNCFSGDLRAFYRSIRQLTALPPETVVYAGHDYVEYAMAFARLVEPQNADIQTYLDKHDPNHVFSTLGDELLVNPFVRYNCPEMISILEKRNLETETEYQRFESVMHLE